MKLNCETILDFYSLKDRRILCQIKVTPPKDTCRCLTKEQWKTFDRELEKLVANTNDWNNEKYPKFSIKPCIEVRVRKSKLTLKHFYKCLGAIGDYKDYVGDDKADFVLECLLHFQRDVPSISSVHTEEYEPQNATSPDGKLCSPLSYTPYTPSKKKYRLDSMDTVKTPGLDFLGYSEETYSPKPVFQTDESEELLPQAAPKYTPATIKASSSSFDEDEVIVETEDEISSQEKVKSSKSLLSKKLKKLETEYLPKSQEVVMSNIPVYIPTPIQEIRQSKETKTYKSKTRKHKTRSNTIDEFPALGDESEDSNGNFSHCSNLRTKMRSKSIDVVPQLRKMEEDTKEKTPKIMKSSNESKEKKSEPAEKSKSEKFTEKRQEVKEDVCSKRDKASKSKKKCKPLPRSSSSEDKLLDSHKKSEKLKISQSQTNSKTSGDEFEDTNIKDKKKNLFKTKQDSNIYISSATIKPLRRSPRSPSKPIRFRDDISESNQNEPKIHKKSHTNHELFGTEDDDDDDENDDFENNNGDKVKNQNKMQSSAFETPENKKSHKSASSTSSSSTKKKRKRDKSSECEQEKRDMSKWLSKKKSSSTADKEPKKSTKNTGKSSSKCPPLKTYKMEKSNKADTDSENRSRSATPISTFKLPSKEEQELIRNKSKLMQEENAKFKAELDKMRTSPPKEVDILSLQNMSLHDILNTFSTHKSALDEIYEKNRERDYIKGHDGINHCFVIKLLAQNIQMRMLDKLTEVYSNTNSSTQATLFANALLPEWVMRVYMEKFQFTREQAIKQIKAQEEFQLHMEEQSDTSFMFD